MPLLAYELYMRGYKVSSTAGHTSAVVGVHVTATAPRLSLLPFPLC
jgi:hypothetical protein